MLLIVAAISFFPFVLAEDDCSNCHIELEDRILKDPVLKIKEGAHLNLSCRDCHLFNVQIQESTEYLKDHEGVPRTLTPMQNLDACALRCHKDTIPFKHGKSVSVKYGPQYSYTCLDCELPVNVLPNDAPVVCTSCHEAHETKNTSDKNSWTHRKNIPETCAGRDAIECHDSSTASEKYDILRSYPGYLSSGHGRMQSLGYEKAAVCIDCHAPNGTSHTAIVEKASNESPINPRNREHTCTQEGCHIGEGVKVGSGSMHGQSEFSIAGLSIESLIDFGYGVLISIFIGGAILFIILDIKKAGKGGR